MAAAEEEEAAAAAAEAAADVGRQQQDGTRGAGGASVRRLFGPLRTNARPVKSALAQPGR